MSMNWFGFGFNGFGQTNPQREDEKEDIRVLSPVKLDSVCTCAETLSRTGLQKSEIQKVVASWSRSAVIHITGEVKACFFLKNVITVAMWCVCVHTLVSGG